MYSHLESKLLRPLAVLALGVAFVVAALITFNSGVLGDGGDSSLRSEEAIDASAGAAPEQAAASEPAAPPETPSQTAPATEKTYEVQDGDSFYSISRKFNTSIAEIQQMNPNLDPSNLSPGTKIVVP